MLLLDQSLSCLCLFSRLTFTAGSSELLCHRVQSQGANYCSHARIFEQQLPGSFFSILSPSIFGKSLHRELSLGCRIVAYMILYWNSKVYQAVLWIASQGTVKSHVKYTIRTRQNMGSIWYQDHSVSTFHTHPWVSPAFFFIHCLLGSNSKGHLIAVNGAEQLEQV